MAEGKPLQRLSAAKHPSANVRVLLVDDDERLLTALERGLRLHGFAVGLARDAGQALGYLESGWPEIVVLDVMLPGMDGLSLCRLVRQRSPVPILMLTALDSVPDRVAGLEAGADDYLVKPFSLDELVARIRALMRRSRSSPLLKTRLSYADLELDMRSWRATRGGEPISLTTREFRLLELFLRHPETVLTREEILAAVWGQEPAVESNVVDVHVANLRQKLEAGGRPRLIKTVRGVGYVLGAGEP